ncbi:transcription factor IIIA isoform X2 [Momordica charantia]|uniref:Transcription factor IIIA isoform X2 n=1 Tax=Momordica charantia TaxID=3673 RepID=A0A6J1CCD6_MOMCH|nr:transcription factor IIIA isoform X2 [Momordica charantia]
MGKAAEHDCGILSEGGRCFCKNSGIEKSDESMVSSHISAHHKMGSDTQQDVREGKTKDGKSNICPECGAAFKKPAYLKQHMLSHSLERPYICSIDGCQASYRRKDHLTRHLLQHQGNVFKCPIESCSNEFASQDSLKRHWKNFHEDDARPEAKCEKQFVCPEDGCGKVFRYGSQLQKHEDSHEAYCAEPGCMRPFTNKQCLKAHIQSCHQYIKCEICGSEKLRKNIKRHLRKHESEGPQKIIQCPHEGCSKVFSTDSNLRQHMKVVHLEQKPFECSFSGCGMRFGYRHVRDNHERSGHHVYINGDFEVADEQFRSKPRGGRKRKCPTVEMLIRKRVTPPSELDFMLNEEC